MGPLGTVHPFRYLAQLGKLGHHLPWKKTKPALLLETKLKRLVNAWFGDSQQDQQVIPGMVGWWSNGVFHCARFFFTWGKRDDTDRGLTEHFSKFNQTLWGFAIFLSLHSPSKILWFLRPHHTTARSNFQPLCLVYIYIYCKVLQMRDNMTIHENIWNEQGPKLRATEAVMSNSYRCREIAVHSFVVKQWIY